MESNHPTGGLLRPVGRAVDGRLARTGFTTTNTRFQSGLPKYRHGIRSHAPISYRPQTQTVVVVVTVPAPAMSIARTRT
jgi:hypothetical protein